MSEETGPLAVAAVGGGPDDVAPPVGQGHDDTHSHGLSDWGYAKIAILLAVVTGAEVTWSYIHWGMHGFGRVAEVGGLLAMMAFKFFFVAANFMHLRFDDRLLTRIFYAGLFLAVIVYLIALTTFHVFW